MNSSARQCPSDELSLPPVSPLLLEDEVEAKEANGGKAVESPESPLPLKTLKNPSPPPPLPLSFNSELEELPVPQVKLEVAKGFEESDVGKVLLLRLGLVKEVNVELVEEAKGLKSLPPED